MATETQWYLTGNWPLVAAALAAIITNGVLIWQTLNGFKLQRDEALRIREIEYCNACIEKWYSPLYVLLLENELAYQNFGPPSYRDLDYQSTEIATKRWSNIVESVIQHNQRKIESVLKDTIGFLHRTDRFESYESLLLHVVSSSLNDSLKSELHKKFPYPSNAKIHIMTMIDNIRRAGRPK